MAQALEIEDFKKSIGKLFEEVAKAIPKMAQTRAITGTALIVKRLRERGIDANGTAYPKYSKNKLPTFFFLEKGTKRAQSKLSGDEFDEGVSYEEWRELNGRQIDHRDFSFTGRTLNSLGIVKTGRDSSGYVVEVFAKGTDEVKKLGYLEEQSGDILTPSKQEEKLLTQDFDDDIQDIIDKNGFGK